MKTLLINHYESWATIRKWKFAVTVSGLMACSSLIESELWSKDAVERQMSHQERNSVRAAYIHKAEHLGERKLMIQWWADYLDVNREKAVSPYNYTNSITPP